MLKSVLSSLALLMVLPYACAPVYRFAPSTPFGGTRFYNPYATTFPWRRANLHAHGRAWLGLTNATQTDDAVVEAYRQRGYDVAAISDYQTIARSGPNPLPVYEHGFNLGKHHQLAIGAHDVTWFDLPLWQGIHQKQYVIGRVAETAALVAIAHPAAMQGYAYSDEELQALSGYQLMEVVNGRFTSESSWDAALSAGRAVWAIADDDTHDVTKADRFAIAWNEIGAPSTAPADLIDALRAGRTYATLRIAPAAAPETMVSTVTERDGVITITLAGRPADISFVGQNGVIRQTSEDTTTASYVFRDDDPYIRAVARTPTRMLFLNPIVRYDGAALPAPAATVAAVPTFIERSAILLGSLFLLWHAARRRRSPTAADRAKDRSRRVAGFVVTLVAATATAARAQPPQESAPDAAISGTAPLTTSFGAGVLPALPTGDSVFSLLETAHVETISDQVSTGGIEFARAPHLSAFGSSITQTRYRIGDIDITDPSAGGTPMLIPELFLWQRIVASTGLASGIGPWSETGADFVTPGLGITLTPQRPAAAWHTEVEGSTSFGDAWTATPVAPAPAIARLTGWNRGSVIATGPLAPDRAGLVVGAAWTRAAQSDRGAVTSSQGDVVSAFAHVVYTVSPRDEVRTLGIVQRTSAPTVNPAVYAAAQPTLADTAVHVQSTWAHQQNAEANWRLFAGYTQQDQSPQSPLASTGTIERLLDGPPLLVAADTDTRVNRRISAGARGLSQRGRHTIAGGIDLDVARSSSNGGFHGIIGELVDGMPARAWVFGSSAATSQRGSTEVAAFGTDRIQLTDHATLDLSLRAERLGASASGAPQGIAWSTFLPRAMVRSTLSARAHVDWFTGGGISASQLPLDALAWGDPAAGSIDVFRWTGGPLAAATLTAAHLWSLGPGPTGRIDPNLKRPYSDDLVFGLEARPAPRLAIELAGLCRWEKQLFAIVNVSPAGPAYSIVNVPDPGLDLVGTSTAQVLAVSNLVLPGTAYQFDNVLTNPAGATARRLGAKLSAEFTGERLFILFGAAAYEADGVAASRGFLSSENDQGLLGEERFDPNASIYDRGRLFGDRAFAGKLSGSYRFPADVTVGAIARYQDGQPFSRLVIVPDLNQGPEIVRAFASGGSRFTFTATLDVRVQKAFVAAGRRVTVFLDGYNITNRSDEVEEQVVTGPTFRTPTAIQPPRAFHLGARLSF